MPRGRCCAPRGRACRGGPVLDAFGAGPAGGRWSSVPLGIQSCGAGEKSCIPGAGSVVGSWSWVPPGIGLPCGRPVLHPSGPVPLPSLGWQDAGCSGCPGGAAPGRLGRQLQDTQVWLPKVGAGTAWLSPGGSHPAWLAGDRAPGSWRCLVPTPSALRGPWVALQSITSGQTSPQCPGLVLAGLAPVKGGECPQPLPPGWESRIPLPLMEEGEEGGGAGHKCTFTSHP